MRKQLAILLVSIGLFSVVNAQTYVAKMDTKDVKKMVESLSEKKVEESIRAAVPTGPDGSDGN